ncbi:MAG: DUF58 domain-containing protein [Planctomycetia bacterium]|nr:DUF58 domain-containing protein [Planctomycetia bacterium]
MRIKNLELRARFVVEGFFSGLHRSPFHGFSVEFTEYRQYSPGDDPRYLDWKLYARSDRYYIKRFEDETNLRCHLVVDFSRSMDYGSLGFTKADYARTLAATLAYFLNSQRDAAGLATFHDQLLDYLPARYRPGHLRRLMLLLDRPAEGTSTNLTKPLERVAELLGKRGAVVLVSDLLAPLDGLSQQLAALTSRGHEVSIFQVLDPTEVRFEFPDPALFVDVESGRELYVDPQATRAGYLRRFEEHQQELQALTDRLGVELVRLTTDRPLEQALFDYLQSRSRRGRPTRRRAMSSGSKGGSP